MLYARLTVPGNEMVVPAGLTARMLSNIVDMGKQ